MSVETVTAKVKVKDPETKIETEQEVSAEYDFGDDHAAMVNEFGAEVVFHHSRSSMRVAFQGGMRLFAQQGKTGADLVSAVENWTMPSGKARGKSKLERAKETIGKLSDSERKEFLESMGL